MESKKKNEIGWWEMLRLRCFRPGVKTQDLADKKKKTKRKIPSSSPPSRVPNSWPGDSSRMASWLLSPTHLHVKWRKRKEKRGGSRTFFFFSRWMSQCRKWTTLYSGTHSRSSFARYGASSNHKKRSPKKITIKREREREKNFWMNIFNG
jgi:hypothetical protein